MTETLLIPRDTLLPRRLPRDLQEGFLRTSHFSPDEDAEGPDWN